MAELSDPPSPPPQSPLEQPEQLSVQPPRASRCCSKKLLILIILAVFVLALGVGYLVGVKVLSPKAPSVVAPQISPYPTPTPDVTANWEMYINDLFGFEVKYPPDCYVAKNGGTKEYPSFHNNKYIGSEAYSPDGLALDFDPIADINRARFTVESRIFEPSKIKNGEINIYFADTKGRKIYATCMVYSGEGNMIDVCNQILSTFRFLDQEQSDESIIRNLVNTTWRSNLKTSQDQNLTISQVKIDRDYATIDAYTVYKDTDQTVPTEGILILAHKVDENWNLAYKGTDFYNTWLDAIPSTLIQPDIKPLLK